MQSTVVNHVPTRETDWPVDDGNRLCWPVPQLPVLFIKDRSSDLSFLVDAGAEVSVLPPTGPPHSRQPTGYSLQAANHSTITTGVCTSQECVPIGTTLLVRIL